MDQRIELFLTDVLALAGEDPEAVREGVRVALNLDLKMLSIGDDISGLVTIQSNGYLTMRANASIELIKPTSLNRATTCIVWSRADKGPPRAVPR
jgi:hypothetical protein